MSDDGQANADDRRQRGLAMMKDVYGWDIPHVVAGGMEDVASLQLDAAVRLGELDAEDLRSIVVFVAHYAGWPRGAKLNTEVEKIIAKMDDA